MIPLILLSLAAAPFPCRAPTFHDGDNIRCGGVTMRLAGIDAPELAGSPKCSRNPRAWCDDRRARQSRDHLRRIAARGPVTCRRAAPDDRYGRPIVRCHVAGVDLGQAQLRARLAKPWP